MITDTAVPSKLGWQPDCRSRRGEADVLVRVKTKAAIAANLKTEDIIKKLKGRNERSDYVLGVKK